MYMSNGDGTGTFGPLDVFCILEDMNTKRYHPAVFEESPFPGPIKDVAETDIVRLKSMSHHTVGFDTVQAAIADMNTTREKAGFLDENVCLEPIPWDGVPGIVWVFSNWRKNGGTFTQMIEKNSTAAKTE